MNHHRLLSIASRTAILSVAALAASAALAWSGPPGAPTACPSGYAGCDAPLNVSATGQTKSGTLYVSAAGNALTGNSTTGGWGGVFYGGGGVYAQSTGLGVQGINSSGNNWGGYFTGGYGVYGQGSSGYGTYGYSTGNVGVYGQTGAGTYGGYFYAPAAGGVGVRGDGNVFGGMFYNTQNGLASYLSYGPYGLYTGGTVYASGGISHVGDYSVHGFACTYYYGATATCADGYFMYGISQTLSGGCGCGNNLCFSFDVYCSK